MEEQTETVFDGMIALDVYFTDEDTKEEIEPAVPVSVRFELSEEALPENIDASTLTVHHLAEDGDASVTVETVATATTSDEVDGVVALSDAAAEKAEVSEDVALLSELNDVADTVENGIDNPAVVAEFEVDAFSYFVLTYNHSVRSGLTAQIVDTSGRGINLPGNDGSIDFGELDAVYDPADFSDKFIVNQWISMDELVGTWAGMTEGYVYHGAYTEQYDQSEDTIVRWIYCRTNYSGVTWYYSPNSSRPNNTPNRWFNESLSELFLVYEEVADTEPVPGLTITDNVITNGCLDAVYSAESDEGTSYYYVWEKSADGQEWDTIRRLRMNGDQYNLTEDGQELNVTLEVVNDESDIGGQWFRVSVYESKEAYDNEDNPLQTSAAMQLLYYDELRNGSFEEPNVEELTNQNSNYQYPVGTQGLIWQTTGEDRQIEIVNETNDLRDGASDYRNTDGAVEGTQYAELNCQSAGALYQDVLTVPGTTLNWQFNHRGRDGNDTMYLLIASTENVLEITDQNDLEGLVSRIQQYGQRINQSTWIWDDYLLVENTANNSGWDYVQGTYTVPEDQYLTRFFFVAGDTAATGEKANTIGNLLDDVRFTTGLLPAQDGTVNLVITKRVEGLSSEYIDDDYKVEVSVKGRAVDQNITLGSTDYTFSEQNDGSYIVTCRIPSINIGNEEYITLTVTETPTDMGNGYTLSSSYNVQAAEDEPALSGNGTSVDLTVNNKETGTVIFTNTYTPTTGDLVIDKVISGIPTDTFLEDQTYTFELTGVTDDEESVTGSFNGGSIVFNNGKATITVTADGEITINNLPEGNYTVKEITEGLSDIGDYHFLDVSYGEHESEGSAIVSVSAGSTATVTVTNVYEHNDQTLSVRKFVTGNMSHEKDEFDFTLTLTDNGRPYTGEIQSDELERVVDEVGQPIDGKYSFTLTAEEGENTLVIELPYGVEATVEETDSEYTESSRSFLSSLLEDTSDGEAMPVLPAFTEGQREVQVTMTDDYTVDFQNKLEIVDPPTGLNHDSTPYTLMITIASFAGLALIGSLFAYRNRRRHRM